MRINFPIPGCKGAYNATSHGFIYNLFQVAVIKNVNVKGTVQFGYCESDVTVCLLFWIMSVVENGELKFL